MVKVAIIPVTAKNGKTTYSAVSESEQTSGKTVGQALDALNAESINSEGGTLVVIQSRKSDRFFNEKQQQRLQELMQRWRTARDNNQSLSEQEQIELKRLVEMEVQASGDRAAALADEATE